VSWQHQAACRTEDPELFFPVGTAGPARLQVEKAQRVCASCPVREACLTYALDMGESVGVWGGTSEEERRTLKRRRSRQQAAAARGGAGADRRPGEAPVTRRAP
jgi:WhiB family redox-sensing transcriptional regulator